MICTVMRPSPLSRAVAFALHMAGPFAANVNVRFSGAIVATWPPFGPASNPFEQVTLQVPMTG